MLDHSLCTVNFQGFTFVVEIFRGHAQNRFGFKPLKRYGAILYWCDFGSFKTSLSRQTLSTAKSQGKNVANGHACAQAQLPFILISSRRLLCSSMSTCAMQCLAGWIISNIKWLAGVEWQAQGGPVCHIMPVITLQRTLLCIYVGAEMWSHSNNWTKLTG